MYKKIVYLCGKKFKCQKDLNDHTTDDHSYRFLCHKRTCRREFSSKAALNKHALTHMPPRYSCTTCGHGFKFQYQLRNHPNTHTDFQIKCRYPRCGRVYKSDSEYNRHYKLHKTAYQEYTCATCVKKFTEKKIWMSTCRYTLPLYALLVQNVEKNFVGSPVSPNIPFVNTPQHLPPPLQLIKTSPQVQNSKGKFSKL